jgi:hypothetical protein
MRRKLWEISSAYLCPLIGTCLPVPVLRRLARRASIHAAASMSDYELHHAAVHLAAARNDFSRLAQKELDARFSAALGRFSQAGEGCALADSWKSAVESGDVAGALWALMTHPLASASLLQLASQDVHMLSHQVGASSRADLRRLAELEQENLELRRRLDEHHCKSTAQLAAKEQLITGLERRLADEAGTQLRLQELESRLSRLGESAAPVALPDLGLARQLADSQTRCSRLEADLAELRRERDASEQALKDLVTPCAHTDPLPIEDGVCGRRVLYVGGRTGLVDQYRMLVERHGGELLHHDGGLEDSLKRLQPLLAAADVVICAAGESSHSAYYLAKRFCKRAGKPCALLRRASLASLLGALRALAQGDASMYAGDTLLVPAV